MLRGLLLAFGVLIALTLGGCDGGATKPEITMTEEQKIHNREVFGGWLTEEGVAFEKRGELHKAEKKYQAATKMYGDNPPESAYENLHRVQQALQKKYKK